MQPGEVKSELFLHLIALLDLAYPNCPSRRQFLRQWTDTGDIDCAFRDWLQNAVTNPSYVPRIAEAIVNIKDEFKRRIGRD